MGRFRNTKTGVVVSVDDSKDDRYADATWESADVPAPAKKTTAKRASSKSEK